MAGFCLFPPTVICERHCADTLSLNLYFVFCTFPQPPSNTFEVNGYGGYGQIRLKEPLNDSSSEYKLTVKAQVKFFYLPIG